MSTTMATATLTAFVSSTATTRNVRCLIVGGDFDLASGSFTLAVDENLSIDQLKQHVLSHLPSESQERIGSELQLFKGFDLYTNTSTSTPTKPKRRNSIGHITSPIEDLLKTTTPEKTANKHFQRKYAMRQRASLGEYLPRGRKCEQSRIDVLISVPKFQLNENLAEMEDEETTEAETEGDSEMDVGGVDYTSDAETEHTVVSETPRKRKRDPVVDEAASAMVSRNKWQRAPCGRVVSVDTLRMRSHCKRCLSMK